MIEGEVIGGRGGDDDSTGTATAAAVLDDSTRTIDGEAVFFITASGTTGDFFTGVDVDVFSITTGSSGNDLSPPTSLL